MNMKPAKAHLDRATIDAIAEAITGGSGFGNSPSVGKYRSTYHLEEFFRSLDIPFAVNNRSRVPAVKETLAAINSQADGRRTLNRIIEALVDPRDHIDCPEKLVAVVEYLNKRLAYDGYQIRQVGKLWQLLPQSDAAVAADALKQRAASLSLASVTRDFDRALSQADADPADAITAACCTIESVCKCLLDEMGKPYPTDKDIKGLVGEVAKHLNLSPGREDLPKDWEQDIRAVLSGLFNVIRGIGALRTHAGDAHGKGKKTVPVDARIARLAIHCASTVSLFYIETWQKLQTPTKKPLGSS
jgi:hypothetical protein